MGFGKINANKLNIAKDENGKNMYEQAVEPTKNEGVINNMKKESGLGKLMSKKKRAKNVFELIRARKL